MLAFDSALRIRDERGDTMVWYVCVRCMYGRQRTVFVVSVRDAYMVGERTVCCRRFEEMIMSHHANENTRKKQRLFN